MLNKKLICIDPWESDQCFVEYSNTIANLGDSVITVRARSSEALSMLPKNLSGNACLLFIDGDHNYPQPLYDMLNYWPFLSEGGALALHDIFDIAWHGGVFRSVTEFFRDKPGYCLHAMNYIPTLAETNYAGHHSAGLIWACKGKRIMKTGLT